MRLAQMASEIERLQNLLKNRGEEIDQLQKRCAQYEEERRKYANIDMKIAQMAGEIERLQNMLKLK